MKDYTKLCPELSKYIEQSVIEADTSTIAEIIEEEPKLSKSKVEEAYAMFKVDPQYLKIALAVGLSVEQVKELHQEFLTYKNYSE